MSPEKKQLYTIIILIVFCLIIITELGNFRAKQLGIDLADTQVKLGIDRMISDLDKERLQEVINSMDERNSYYNELRQNLMAIRAEHGLADIYLLSKDEEKGQWFYIADARAKNDPESVELGEVDIRLFGALEGIARGKIVEKEYYRTAEGTFISNYQGIEDGKGNIIAVAGGDYAAKEMAEFLYLTRYVQVGIAFLSLLLIGGTVLVHRR